MPVDSVGALPATGWSKHSQDTVKTLEEAVAAAGRDALDFGSDEEGEQSKPKRNTKVEEARPSSAKEVSFAAALPSPLGAVAGLLGDKPHKIGEEVGTNSIGASAQRSGGLKRRNMGDDQRAGRRPSGGSGADRVSGK
jgi:hypothetical protein